MSEITGLPGVKSGYTATPRDILCSEVGAQYARKPLVLDASATRDYGNNVTSATDNDCEIIRAGTILIKDANGLYVPWILGKLTAAYVGSGSVTTLTVGIGAAVAINKYLGGDGAGTVYITGPPTAAGTINNTAHGYDTVTVSSISESAGTLTISDLATDYIAGSLIHPQDGYASAVYTYAPDCILADKYGVKLTDRKEADVDSPIGRAVVGGNINTTYIVGWPAAANTTLVLWVKQELHRNMPNLTFNDLL